MKFTEFITDPSFIPNRSPNAFGYLKQFETDQDPINFLIIGGTHYDKGYWYGKFLGEQLLTSIRRSSRFVAHFGLGVSGQKLTKNDLYTHMDQTYAEAGMHRWEEIRGIIEGCREGGYLIEDVREIGVAMTIFEMNEAACCSSCAVNYPGTKENTYHINNSDFPFRFGFLQYPTVILYFPQDNEGNRIYHAFAGVSYAGLYGGIGGMNEKGVVFGEIRSSNIVDKNSPEGIPVVYLMNDALMHCGNVPEMRSFVASKPRTIAYTVTVSDPLQKPNSLDLWFFGHTIMKTYHAGEMIDKTILRDLDYGFYEPLQEAVYWMDMPAPGVEAGPEKVYEILQKYSGSIDDAKGLAIAKELGNKFTIISSLYKSTTLEFWVSFASNKTPAPLRKYQYINMRTYLDQYDRLIKNEPIQH